jgi:hypothetical protein
MHEQTMEEIQAQAAPLMVELLDAAGRHQDCVSGIGFALAYLQCLAITTVQKERDTKEGVRFLHELLDVQIKAAQRHKAQGKL